MIQQTETLFDDVVNDFREEQPYNLRRKYFCNSVLSLFHSNKKLQEVLSEYKKYQLGMVLPADVCHKELKLFMEFAQNRHNYIPQ